MRPSTRTWPRANRSRPPTSRGDDPQFSASKLTDGDRNTYWAANDDVRTCELTVELGKATALNHVRLQEYIQLGQRIEGFAVDARVDGAWKEIATGTTIGPRKILRTPTVTADAVGCESPRAEPARPFPRSSCTWLPNDPG